MFETKENMLWNGRKPESYFFTSDSNDNDDDGDDDDDGVYRKEPWAITLALRYIIFGHMNTTCNRRTLGCVGAQEHKAVNVFCQLLMYFMTFGSAFLITTHTLS